MRAACGCLLPARKRGLVSRGRRKMMRGAGEKEGGRGRRMEAAPRLLSSPEEWWDCSCQHVARMPVLIMWAPTPRSLQVFMTYGGGPNWLGTQHCHPTARARIPAQDRVGKAGLQAAEQGHFPWRLQVRGSGLRCLKAPTPKSFRILVKFSRNRLLSWPTLCHPVGQHCPVWKGGPFTLTQYSTHSLERAARATQGPWV